jgi:hypothetical protein
MKGEGSRGISGRRRWDRGQSAGVSSLLQQRPKGLLGPSGVTSDVEGAVTDQWAGLPLALQAVKMKRKITKDECPSETFLRNVVTPQIPKIASQRTVT